LPNGSAAAASPITGPHSSASTNKAKSPAVYAAFARLAPGLDDPGLPGYDRPSAVRLRPGTEKYSKKR